MSTGHPDAKQENSGHPTMPLEQAQQDIDEAKEASHDHTTPNPTGK